MTLVANVYVEICLVNLPPPEAFVCVDVCLFPERSLNLENNYNI